MVQMRPIKNSLIRHIVTLSRILNFPKRNNINTVLPKFLVVSTTGIGDTIWGTPAIRALKETYPSGYIGVLTTGAGAELLRGNPYIDRVFIFKRGARFFSILNLLRELRAEEFDIAFIFHASDRIVWPLVFFTGASQIIGIIGQNKGLDFILTKAIKKEDVHAVEMRLRLAGEAGALFGSASAPALYLSEEEKKAASKFLVEMGLNRDSLIIGLHPGAQKPFKRWPAERFIDTGRRLSREVGCRIIITGDRKERGLCEYIATQITGAVSIAGMTNLRETAAIIERMRLFITNDTGPMHIAFALGTPTVALFCPTDPMLCGPYKVKNAITIKRPVICNPCIGKGCEVPVCMEQITVEEVVEKSESLLNKERGYAGFSG